MLESVIEETKSFFEYLKNKVFKENGLDLGEETDTVFSLLFNEF